MIMLLLVLLLMDVVDNDNVVDNVDNDNIVDDVVDNVIVLYLL